MAAQQQQGSGGDNSLAPLWITLLVFIAAWMIWHFAHGFIVMVVFHIKLVQAHLVSYFTEALRPAISFMQNMPYGSVSLTRMMDVSAAVGTYMRYPFIVIMMVLAIRLYFSDVTSQYCRTYTMDALAKDEVQNWPVITPVVSLDLVNTDITKGPWAMGMQPMEFAMKHKIVKIEEPKKTAGMLSSRANYKISLLRGETRKTFALQLGDYWRGVEHVPKHIQALFAIFAARINRDRDGAYKLLNQLAASTKNGHLNYTGVKELVDKHKDTKYVKRVCGKHAYTLTVMASMVERARADGVVPTSEFLWLKPVDRQLWYMLNSVGRQTPFVEVGGAFAHWLAEKQLGRKVMVPMIQEAVLAIELALKDIKYNPDKMGPKDEPEKEVQE